MTAGITSSSLILKPSVPTPATNPTIVLPVTTAATLTPPVSRKRLPMVPRSADIPVSVMMVSMVTEKNATQKSMSATMVPTDVTSLPIASTNQLVTIAFALTVMSVTVTDAPSQSTNVP